MPVHRPLLIEAAQYDVAFLLSAVQHIFPQAGI